MQPGQIEARVNIDATIRMMEHRLMLMRQAMDARQLKAEAEQAQIAAELGLMQMEYEQVSGTLSQLKRAKELGAGSPIIPPSALGFQ